MIGFDPSVSYQALLVLYQTLACSSADVLTVFSPSLRDPYDLLHFIDKKTEALLDYTP